MVYTAESPLGNAPNGSPLTACNGPHLTVRQFDVLRRLMKGEPNKVIARQLGLVEGTVKIHLAAIYRALGVRTRAEAIAKLKSN